MRARCERVRGFRVFGLLALLVALGQGVPAASAGEAMPAGLPQPVLAMPLVQVQDDDEWRSRLAGLFEQGALANEQGMRRPITRWDDAIDIAVRGDAARAWIAVTETIADEIAAVTGLPIEVHEAPLWAGDIDIYITNRAGYWPFFVEPADRGSREPFTCIALPYAVDGRMRQARIHINAGVLSAATVRACLMEEIFQSMGFFGEVPDDSATILNDEVGFKRLGTVDRLLLATLYDPRLQPGMHGDEALPLARRILDEWLTRLR